MLKMLDIWCIAIQVFGKRTPFLKSSIKPVKLLLSLGQPDSSNRCLSPQARLGCDVYTQVYSFPFQAITTVRICNVVK